MSKQEYVRDSRSPIPKSENVSKVMSANKSKSTKPEIFLRKEMSKNGLRGYRVNYKKLPGSPDITFTKKKVCIFVNGCFWHRCPTCNYALPKTNTLFWQNKFSKNVLRDKQKKEQLQSLGWSVIVVWECDIKKDIYKVIAKIKNALA